MKNLVDFVNEGKIVKGDFKKSQKSKEQFSTKEDVEVEIKKTKGMMDALLDLVKEGKKEYHQDYTDVSMYYMMLHSYLSKMK